MPISERTAVFIPIVCRCGRNLRAKADQIGTEIRCWDCQQMVLVPMPREHQKVAQELSEGVKVVIKGQALNWLLVSATLLTAALCVPEYGLAVAALVLFLGTSIYGNMIRSASGGGESPARSWKSFLLPSFVPSSLIGVLMAAGTVFPLWFMNASVHRSPHWNGWGILIASLSWTVLPIGMFLLFGSDHEGRLGWKTCLKLLARHPIATTLALAVVPFGCFLMEAGLGLFLFLLGHLPFFALDFMPIPGEPIIFEGIPYYNTLDFRSYPSDRFVAAYFSGLRHGYSFLGAIPASLSLPTRAGLSGAGLSMSDTFYAAVRIVMTWIFVIWMLTMFAIQARWLGSIPLIERRRPG